ncbi:MAG TPA: hypothetical protein VFH39_01835 [Candidatus Saccharimonadales bacterium]|nr:hypothetical protein [Candidatus Saccharimonadales bacterium]
MAAPEVLNVTRPDFDPLEHLAPFARHQNIAFHPAKPGKILRWYPHQDTWDCFDSPKGANSALHMNQQHLGFLASATRIAVPKHYDFIAQEPPYSNENPAYAVFSELDLIAGCRPVDAKDDVRLVWEALTKYHSWVVTTDQPVILHDAFKLDQYHVTNKGVTLLDIDPYFAETRGHTMGLVRQQLRNIGTIVS